MSIAPTTNAATRKNPQQTANHATIERGNINLPTRREQTAYIHT
jgi:hypothetical protein